jgi:hypothetical protein
LSERPLSLRQAVICSTALGPTFGVNKTSEDVLGIPKVGPKAVEQITACLKDNGLSLKEI